MARKKMSKKQPVVGTIETAPPEPDWKRLAVSLGAALEAHHKAYHELRRQLLYAKSSWVSWAAACAFRDGNEEIPEHEKQHEMFGHNKGLMQAMGDIAALESKVVEPDWKDSPYKIATTFGYGDGDAMFKALAMEEGK